MKVSVIISHFRQMECAETSNFPYWEASPPMKSCLASVERQTYLDIEVVHADRVELKNSFLIRNEAAKRANGDILLFIDGDVVLPEDCVEKLVTVFRRTGADAVAGTSVVKDDMSFLCKLLGAEFEERFRRMGESWVDVNTTTFFAIRREVFNKVGGFPVKSPTVNLGGLFFSSNFADWDFCGLLKEKGFRIFHSNRVTYSHYLGTDLKGYLKKQFWHGAYRMWFTRRFKTFTESYANWRVMGQPVFAILTGLFGLLCLLNSMFTFFTLLSGAVTLLWYLDWAVKFALKLRDWRMMLLLPLSFIRCYVWVLGALYGRWKM